ncbi:MAG: TetR/AcrR family transcriptional regulator [Alphaproteobacteria bacterium]|nr:TetR/AcrR family transcriptional regulator [Alphaproteobacteria bacterium]
MSVDDICTRAGAKKGSFYHFFPSKADLAIAALDEHWKVGCQKFDSAFSPDLDPRERFLRYCDLVYEKQADKFKEFGKVCGCAFASLGSEQSTQDERLRRKTEEIFECGIRYLETAVRDAIAIGQISGGDPAAKAREVFSYVMGVMVSAKVLNDLEVIRRDLRPGVFRIIGMELPVEEHA